MFVKTGTFQEKRISQTFIEKYRWIKQVTISHGYFFLLACIVVAPTPFHGQAQVRKYQSVDGQS